jgi:integrase
MKDARQRAHDYGYVSVRTARMYRKELELAFGALLPERRRTFRGMRLGEHLVRNKSHWSLRLPSDLGKGDKPLRASLPPEFNELIDDYVERFRLALPGSSQHDRFGQQAAASPCSQTQFIQSMARTTKKQLSIAISLHVLRRSVATDWKRLSLERLPDAQLHLDHEDDSITLGHYAERQVVVGDALTSALGLTPAPRMQAEETLSRTSERPPRRASDLTYRIPESWPARREDTCHTIVRCGRGSVRELR